jgi:TP901 family phage tail tape measure protein
MADMTLMMRLFANGSGLRSELARSDNSIKAFTNNAKRNFQSLSSSVKSLSAIAGIGGGSYAMIQMLKSSAALDKNLTQIGQTAGASKLEVAALRNDLFSLSKTSGQGVEDLKDGFNSLVQSGLNMKEAKATLDGINMAMAVTGANAQTLSGGLTVAAQAFQFDLSKPGKALELLDKMTVAGRLGNAELQNLSDIFGRVGVNASSAGMSFDKTLAFIETLSLVERNPERLATLADSTLRIFTNLNYMKQAQKALGGKVKFFDASGQRRDALAVLKDMKTEYDKLKTDQERSKFIGKVFGKADLDTIKGMRTLLQGDMITKSSQFSKTITSASGTLERDMDDAISNAVDQTGRLKTALREAADGFIKPINNTIQNSIKFLMDKREKGGLELTGKEMAIGGVATLAGGAIAAMTIGKLARSKGLKLPGSNALGNLGGTAIGVAEGLALQKATGVMPVFVTNFPAGFGGGPTIPLPGPSKIPVPGKGIPLPPILTGGGSLLGTLGTNALVGGFAALNAGSLAAAFAAAPVMASGLVGAAGAAGYGFGSLINNAPNLWGGKDISESIADALFEALHRDYNNPELNNNITIMIDKDGKVITDTKGASKTPAKVRILKRGSFDYDIW